MQAADPEAEQYAGKHEPLPHKKKNDELLNPSGSNSQMLHPLSERLASLGIMHAEDPLRETPSHTPQHDSAVLVR